MQQHPGHDPQQPLGVEQHLPVSLDTTRGTLGLPGVGPDDSDPPVEEILEHIDPYIVAQVEKILAGSPDIAPWLHPAKAWPTLLSRLRNKKQLLIVLKRPLPRFQHSLHAKKLL